MTPDSHRREPRRPARVLLLRALLISGALVLWFWTQGLIGSRAFPDGSIGDAVFRWTAPVHDYLSSHPRGADVLLIASSAVIDVVGLSLIAVSVLGPSLRPFLALFLLFALRQACQGLCALPAPEGMIWRDPGFPALLVTYGVSTDLFFSGHTGLAVLGAVELCRRRSPWLSVLGVILVIFEVGTVLVLRAHYTLDVFTGAVTALYVSALAAAAAPPLDRWVARRAGGGGA